MNVPGAFRFGSIGSMILLLAAFSLSPACRSAYYGAMEKFGFHKREILVDRVEDARNAQQKAKEQFESALDKFRTVLRFKGGKLEEKYDQLNAELKVSEARADAVRKDIASVQDVAEALFDEWRSELDQYQDEDLRRASKLKLEKTRARYSALLSRMKRAEKSMDPVLAILRDQVLFLKHNLNASAIESLQGKLGNVEAEVSSLIKAMEASISEADAFIKSISAGT